MKDLTQITLEEFQAMEEFGQNNLFNEVIIVPTEDIHDSGYRCMKFVLALRGRIVGCVGGYCDIAHPNMFKPTIVQGIDCLPKSSCIRLMFHSLFKCDNFIGSDFMFYEDVNE